MLRKCPFAVVYTEGNNGEGAFYLRSSGHTVLITGGASGIGLALTKQFIRHGNKVIIVGRNVGKLNEVKANDPKITVIGCDINHEDDTGRLVKELYQNYPDLSVLVNNAGIQYNYSFADSPDAHKLSKIREEIDINLTAPIRLTMELLPLLSRHEESAVVNVSSGLGLTPKKSAPVYCATKAGLHVFTKALRYQLEPTGVKVFEIIPPLVDTAMTRGRGRRKLSAESLAGEFWRAYRRDREEVLIGKVKLLKWLNRLAPAVAERILKNS
jgi:uncharacterized oxidoreductase